MVQFLSIIFFFFNFCWVFQKFPFFCVTFYVVVIIITIIIVVVVVVVIIITIIIVVVVVIITVTKPPSPHCNLNFSSTEYRDNIQGGLILTTVFKSKTVACLQLYMYYQ